MRNILIILAVLCLTSCEKIVELDYNNNEPKMVIEGSITNEAGVYFVKLTQSVPLMKTEENPTIDNATVRISDDAGNSELLIPQGNGLYSTSSLLGISGRAYTLTVEANGQAYTAHSSMPQQVTFDSIKVEEVASPGGEKEFNLIPIYTDAPEPGNYYRFVLKVNGQIINQHFVLNDEITNGLENTLKLEINSDDLLLASGDSIELEMQCVDKSVGLFYMTLALIGNSGPGGGTTPANPPSNISNAALGVFSANTIERKSTVIP